MVLLGLHEGITEMAFVELGTTGSHTTVSLNPFPLFAQTSEKLSHQLSITKRLLLTTFPKGIKAAVHVHGL